MSDHRTKKADPHLLPWSDQELVTSSVLAWPELYELAPSRHRAREAESKVGSRHKPASHSSSSQALPHGSWLDLFVSQVGTFQQQNVASPAKEVEREIEKLYELAAESPSFVADELNRILNSLGEATDLGCAKLRMVVRRTPDLPLGEAPEWLTSQLDSLQSDGELPRSLIPTTVFLIKASLAARPGYPPSKSTAEISSYMGGRIEVAWNTRNPMRWIIDNASMPLPGINVRAYTAVREDSHILQCTRFHYAGSLIKQASTILRREE